MPPKKVNVPLPDGSRRFQDKQKKPNEKRGNPNLKVMNNPPPQKIEEKPVEQDVAKPKAKGRGKKPVGTIVEALEGKAKKANVKVGKKDIKDSMINEYRKELDAKKEKIERNLKILSDRDPQ